MLFPVMFWRIATTRSPKVNDVWISRADPETTVRIINMRDGWVTAAWVSGSVPPVPRFIMHDSEFVCFWRKGNAAS